MKRVLIISPHFPPLNYPDMHRIRMSLPYYKQLGWEPVVIAVHEKFVNGYCDTLLNETIPEDIEIHKIKAWPLHFTKLAGLGSTSIRSLYYFKKKGNELLRKRKFDLIFFSTSMFHVCVLGRYWKQKFIVPFIVDFQDPWRNDFYLINPSATRPPKFKIAYTIHKKMEAYTMPYADGITAVSQSYIDTLQLRYPVLKNRPSVVLPFGNSENDFKIVYQKHISPQVIDLHTDKIQVVYIGAVTQFFIELIRAFFIAFITDAPDIEMYHFYFIGTNYKSKTDKPVERLAIELGIQHLVTEIPERISYFAAIATMTHSDILFIPGSLDADYNASKVYNNIQTGRPVFSIFNEKSLVCQVIQQTNAGIVIAINAGDDINSIIKKIRLKMPGFFNLHRRTQKTDLKKMEIFGAKSMTLKQVEFFNKVV